MYQILSRAGVSDWIFGTKHKSPIVEVWTCALIIFRTWFLGHTPLVASLESAKTGYLDGPDVGQKWAMAQNANGPHFCGPLFIWLPDLGSNQGHTD